MNTFGFSPYVVLFLLLVSSFTLATEIIDLQWAICDKDAETVLRKLGEVGKEPHKANNITYYDAWPPEYTQNGLAFRTKVHKHQPISMIKARFGEETENVPSEANCVWDRYGEAIFYTCGLPSPLYVGVEDIWSEEQKSFAERYEHVNWTSLVPYGPFLNPKWKLRIEGHKAVFDDVMASAAGSPLHLMEMEVAIKKSEGDKVHRKITEYLRSHGVVICEEPQLSKTMRLFNALEVSSSTALDQELSVSKNETSDETQRKEDLKR